MEKSKTSNRYSPEIRTRAVRMVLEYQGSYGPARCSVRGKAIGTTIPDTSVPCPRDKVNRQFRAPAPNMLWVGDFTYVSTWQGFAYVAFVIDTFANRVRHWSRTNGDQRLTRVESITVSPRPTAFWMRLNKPFTRDDRLNPPNAFPFAIPSDWQMQVSSRRLAASVMPMIEPVDAIGSRPLARALAETINGLYKTEVIRRRKSWRSIDDVEMETLKWVDWFNHVRGF